jgi:hypothetical protein
MGSNSSAQTMSVETGNASVPNHRPIYPTFKHKGLQNLDGENNCFLNVTIQALWHLGPFRIELQRLLIEQQHQRNNENIKPSGDKESEKDPDLISVLSNLFVQYEFSELSVLPPTELRIILHELTQRFEIGSMADCNDAFVTILERIHEESKSSCPTPSKCLSHRVFGGVVLEQSVCDKCGASSEPTLRSDFIYYTMASELVAQAQEVWASNLTVLGSTVPMSASIPAPQDTKNSNVQINFGTLLKKCIDHGIQSCPSVADDDASVGLSRRSSRRGFHTIENPILQTVGTPIQRSPRPSQCTGTGWVISHSLEAPLALAISIGWTQTRECAENIHELLSLISYTINLVDVFGLIDDGISQNDSAPANSSVKSKSSTRSSLFRRPSREPINTTQEKQSQVQSKNKGPTYVFRGLVCYYGKHYVSIFQEYRPGEAQFLLFDDSNIRVIGTWSDVKAECLKSLYQPVLLLYELERESSKYVMNPTTDLSPLKVEKNYVDPKPVVPSEPKPSNDTKRNHLLKSTEEVQSKTDERDLITWEEDIAMDDLKPSSRKVTQINVHKVSDGNLDETLKQFGEISAKTYDNPKSNGPASTLPPHLTRSITSEFAAVYAETDRSFREKARLSQLGELIFRYPKPYHLLSFRTKGTFTRAHIIR